MIPFFFLDPSVTRWDDKKGYLDDRYRERWDDRRRGTGMTRKEGTWMTSFRWSAQLGQR
ncbi:MAG: hypothetical protein LKM45_06260 [Wolbachia endosymbiont of Alcedoecus sp.]|nr:hypothetical protein [Wolbachia endosymbiont of Alcedoecus sp.]